MMIKLNLLEKFVIGILLIALSIVTIDILTTQKVAGNNTKVINGHLSRIYGIRAAKGDLHYDLYIKENNEYYKISADLADCFYYNDFATNVRENQMIQIKIMNKTNLIVNSNLHFVVALSSNGHEYLNTDCVNENIEKNKWLIAILWILGITAGIVFWDVKKRKYKKAFSKQEISERIMQSFN